MFLRESLSILVDQADCEAKATPSDSTQHVSGAGPGVIRGISPGEFAISEFVLLLPDREQSGLQTVRSFPLPNSSIGSISSSRGLRGRAYPAPPRSHDSVQIGKTVQTRRQVRCGGKLTSFSR